MAGRIRARGNDDERDDGAAVEEEASRTAWLIFERKSMNTSKGSKQHTQGCPGKRGPHSLSTTTGAGSGSGNRPTMMTARYSHLSEGHLRKAVGTLPDW